MLYTKKLDRVDLMLGVLITHTQSKGTKKSFGDDRYVYYLDCGDVITSVCICPAHQNV